MQLPTREQAATSALRPSNRISPASPHILFSARARPCLHDAVFLLVQADEKRVGLHSSSRQHPARPTRRSRRKSPLAVRGCSQRCGHGWPSLESSSLMIQVSFAPPPREELTTRLPSGAIRVRARPASRL